MDRKIRLPLAVIVLISIVHLVCAQSSTNYDMVVSGTTSAGQWSSSTKYGSWNAVGDNAIVVKDSSNYNLREGIDLSPPPDWDIDTIPDYREGFPPVAGQSNRYLKDSDGDGLPDGVEDANRNGSQDSGETSTRNRDSDGDGLSDGLEVKVLYTDPLNASDPGSYTDDDGDGVPATHDPDDYNPDTDGDTYRDGYELEMGTDPTDPASKPGLGDLNQSGTVTNTDWVIGRRLTLGLFPWENYNIDNMDVNRDGLLNNTDWVILRRYTLKMSGFEYLPK